MDNCLCFPHQMLPSTPTRQHHPLHDCPQPVRASTSPSALHEKLEKLRLCTLPGCSLKTIGVAEQLLSASLNILSSS